MTEQKQCMLLVSIERRRKNSLALANLLRWMLVAVNLLNLINNMNWVDIRICICEWQSGKCEAAVSHLLQHAAPDPFLHVYIVQVSDNTTKNFSHLQGILPDIYEYSNRFPLLCTSLMKHITLSNNYLFVLSSVPVCDGRTNSL